MTRPPKVHKYAGDDPAATRTACGLALSWATSAPRRDVTADVRRVSCGNCARTAKTQKCTLHTAANGYDPTKHTCQSEVRVMSEPAITDTPHATTEDIARDEIRELIIDYVHGQDVQFRCDDPEWDKPGHSPGIDEPDEAFYDAVFRAVLSVPRVAAGLKLLEAIESFELMDPQMSAGRTAQARAVHAGVVGGRNAVLERLRAIAGITELRS